MKGSTLKIIILLTGLLFLNIEAAQAGLLIKMKSFIGENLHVNTVFIIAAFIIAIVFTYYALFDRSLNIKDQQSKSGKL